jgi:hypothetical protein
VPPVILRQKGDTQLAINETTIKGGAVEVAKDAEGRMAIVASL